jgi:hypothetical protein
MDLLLLVERGDGHPGEVITGPDSRRSFGMADSPFTDFVSGAILIESPGG